MKRKQFLKKLNKYARKSDITYRWRKDEGKGSHGTVYLGATKTVVKHGELSNDYIDVVLTQLGIGKDVI